MDINEDIAYVLPAQSTLKAIRALSLCTYKENMRSILTGIQVIVKDQRVTITATDSFRLGTIEFDARDCREGSFLIPSELIGQIVKAFTRTSVAKMNPTQSLTFTVNTSATITFNCDESTFEAHTLEGTYPSWEQLLPAPDAYVHEFAMFNPTYLVDLGRMVVEWASKETPVLVNNMTTTRPSLFSINSPDKGIFRYLLMPLPTFSI